MRLIKVLFPLGWPHYGDPFAGLDVHVRPGHSFHPIFPQTVHLREFSGFYYSHSQLLLEDLCRFTAATSADGRGRLEAIRPPIESLLASPLVASITAPPRSGPCPRQTG